MSDAAVIDAPPPTQALARVESATPLPLFTGAEMSKALTAYRELQQALDRAMPEQIMELDGKPFRKKGYWRAIAVAFNLTVEPIAERREVSGIFEDGRDNFGHIITYRASTQTGRSATGDGSCFAVEKARRFRCPHPEKPGSKRTLHFPAEACPDFDPAFQWKTLPAQATEHNIRSHAHTRAFNRAVSNLVGFGEVSAEEIEREEHAPIELQPQTPTAPTANRGPVPDGFSYIEDFRVVTGWFHAYRTLPNGARVDAATKKETLGEILRQAYQDGVPVRFTMTKDGKYIDAIEVWKPPVAEKASGLPLTAEDVGF